MADELLDIFSDGKDKISHQKLMNYLEGKLSPEEMHEVEKEMLDSGMTSDAIEGLQSVSDTGKLRNYEKDLQRKLKQQLQKRDKRRSAKKIKEMPWIYIFIVIILLLALVAFWVVANGIK